MVKSVVVKEGNGDIWVLHFEIFGTPFDLKKAVRNACEDYMKTEDGMELARENEGTITWKTFWNEVPNAICRKHGFYKQKREIIKESHDWDEAVYNEND